MKISVLAITNRPAFLPWLLWQYERLDWPDKELILVDGSEQPPIVNADGVAAIHAPGRNIPALRNLAVDAASGAAVTWLDDDDWTHPARLTHLVRVMDDHEGASSRLGWFVDLFGDRCKRFALHGPLFNALLLRMDVARSLRFDEEQARGSDVAWLKGLRSSYSVALTETPLAFLLCHRLNVGNLAAKHHFNRSLDDIRRSVGRAAWGQTSRQLAALRRRLAR